MTSSAAAEPCRNQMQSPRRHIGRAAALLACLGIAGWSNAASATLIGAQVSYESLFPNTNSVLNNLGTQTITPLTDFADTKNNPVLNYAVFPEFPGDRNSPTPPKYTVSSLFGSSGDDQWKPVQNGDGSYTFYNLHSGLVLEDPGSSTNKTTQMDQWSSTGGANQNWKLLSQ